MEIGVLKNIWGKNKNGIFTRDFSIDRLQLYLPLWHPELNGSTIVSKDLNAHSCTVTEAVWGVTGRTFDTNNDQIDCGKNSVLDGSSDTTVIVWFKKAALGAEGCFVSKNNVNLQDRYRFKVASTNKLGVDKECQDGGLLTVSSASVTISAATWYFAAVRFGAAGVSLVQDSTEVGADATNTTVLTAGTASSLFIGDDYNGNGAPGATIGDVLIYRRYLSAGELENIRQATKWRYA